jgi:hypothetical protein
MGRRLTELTVIAFIAGLLLYGFFCYRVLLAGGLAGGMSATSLRPTCSKAAIGSETRDYRSDESVEIKRSYLPPTAICQWSGGTTAALIPANALSSAGPVLIAASALTALSIKAGDAVRKRNPARRAPS